MSSKSYFHNFNGKRRYTYTATDDPIGTTINRSFDSSATDSFSGSDNYNWKDGIRRHVDVTNNASGIRTSVSVANGTVFRRRRHFANANIIITEVASGFLPSGLPLGADPGGAPTSNADTQAKLKFFQQYRSRRTAFQGGTFFGELAETLRMLKSPAKALREGVDRYAKAARRAARKAGRLPKKQNAAVAETYLEYAFGWSPLFHDIHDIAEVARHSQRTYLQDLNAEFSENTSSDIVRNSYSEQALAWKCNQRTTFKASVRYKGAVLAETPPPSFAEFVGFAPTNFLPTIWELIPYSFLVDYFTNIGNVIDGMSLGKINLAWCCKTVRQECNLVISGWDTNMDPDQYLLTQYATSSDHVVHVVRFTRSANTPSVGVDDISFRLPGIGSPWKWLNIGALARAKSVHA